MVKALIVFHYGALLISI